MTIKLSSMFLEEEGIIFWGRLVYLISKKELRVKIIIKPIIK